MSNSIEDKLEELRQAYQIKLPDKVNEIAALWKLIENQPNQEDVILLHRKAHSLHGSAASYGFSEIGNHAAVLENIIKPLLSNITLIADNKNKIDDIINKLKLAIMTGGKAPT